MDFLLLQPADTDISSWAESDDPAEQQMHATLQSIRAEWPPSGHCPGTIHAAGQQLTQARADASLAEVEGLIAQFNLPWTVIAAQDEITGEAERPVDPATVLPFLPGSVTEADLRAGTVQLPRYAGHPPWQLSD